MELQKHDKGSTRPAASVSEALTSAVADTYVLYFQTQSFHWNVKGPYFASLHAMFETQYDELAEAVDELAERLRATGAVAPASLPELLAWSGVSLDSKAGNWRSMVECLLRGHRELARSSRERAELADEVGDGVTNDLFIERATAHEKTAWMLEATLAE